jgi:hypothetical protein
MTEFIGIGDLHFSSSAGRGGLSRIIKDHDDYVRREVEKVKTYARKKGVTNIVQYGDVCEEPRASYAATLAMLDMFADDDFVWHIILGNHDKFAEESSAGHSLELIKRLKLPNVRIYTEPKDITLGKAKLRMLPWPHTDWSETYLNVAHVDIEGCTGDNGRLSKSNVKHNGTSVIGHIHTSQKVKGAHYVGTLYQTNFGESPEKYFHHCINDGGWDINKVPHKSEYSLHTIEVESKKDLEKIDKNPKKLYKLKLLNAKAISSADYGSNVVMVVPTSKEVEEVTLDTSGASVEFDPNAFFEEWVERQTVSGTLKKQAIQLRKEYLNVG